MKDLYGRGVWWIFVPIKPENDNTWLWDSCENDAVCVQSGEWLTTKMGIPPPNYVNHEERCVLFSSDEDQPCSISELMTMIKLE